MGCQMRFERGKHPRARPGAPRVRAPSRASSQGGGRRPGHTRRAALRGRSAESAPVAARRARRPHVRLRERSLLLRPARSLARASAWRSARAPALRTPARAGPLSLLLCPSPSRAHPPPKRASALPLTRHRPLARTFFMYVRASESLDLFSTRRAASWRMRFLVDSGDICLATAAARRGAGSSGDALAAKGVMSDAMAAGRGGKGGAAELARTVWHVSARAPTHTPARIHAQTHTPQHALFTFYDPPKYIMNFSM